jgi:hypothetical protein
MGKRYKNGKTDGTPVILATARIIDGQPPVPSSFNSAETSTGDYVLLDNEGVRYTSATEHSICETQGWGNYLQEDWMYFPSDGSSNGDGETEEYTVRMLFDLGAPILVYRELLELPETKTAKRKDSSSSSSSSSTTGRSRTKSGGRGGAQTKKATKSRPRRK